VLRLGPLDACWVVRGGGIVTTNGLARAMVANILWWLAGVWLALAITRGPIVPAIGSILMVAWLWRAVLVNNRQADIDAAWRKAYFSSHGETTDENGDAR
jgi:hypothetical protein